MIIPQLSTAKLVGMGVGALALIAAVLWFRSVLGERAELRAWKVEVVAATREAAGNPKLGEQLVGQQVRLLGGAIKQCKASIALQNMAIGQLATATAEQGRAVAAAQKRATERVGAVDATRRGLEASSRSSAAQAKPCAPSNALTEAWR
jgi:hypothetical protein